VHVGKSNCHMFRLFLLDCDTDVGAERTIARSELRTGFYPSRIGLGQRGMQQNACKRPCAEEALNTAWRA
jgi:hypothetical protein